MPIHWRCYFKAFIPTLVFYTFFLTLLSFLFRFKELLFFIDSDAPKGHLFNFIFYNLPFFFTLACPLSAAVAGFLVSQRRSLNLEWTTLGALGLSRLQILSPIFLAAAHLFLFIFWLNCDICPKYRLEGKKAVLDAIYQNPSLLIQHYQTKSHPLAIHKEVLAKDDVNHLTVAIFDSKTNQLDLVELRNIQKKENEELAAEKCHHVHFKQQDLVVSEFNEPAIDLKNLPITFHFPKNYEEHLPMRSGITLNEIARRICISLLPVSLFLLATAAGIQRNMRSETKEVIPFLLIGIFTYFIYLIVRSMNQSLPLVYLSIPLIPIPLTVYKLSRDLR